MGGFYGGFLMVRIAIVEDDELYISQLQQYLTDYQKQSGEDFDIKVYRDGDAVTADYKAQHDIILMDIQMPLMNGYEATRRIRAMDDPEIAGIPIIAMTANAFSEDVSISLEAGMNDHISKPLELKRLYQVLGKYLGTDPKNKE